MKVFYTGLNPNHAMSLTPAKDHRIKTGDIDAGWLNPDGSAITFQVAFRGGKAEVPDALGRYMVLVGMAWKIARPNHVYGLRSAA